jgi:hypothetical protein
LPGGFLAVARDVNVFKTAYGAAAPVVGNYVNQLGTDGGTIRLLRPSAGGPDETVDEVTFRKRAPWPTSADGGGPSLQLIDARQDNGRLGNWSAVSGTSTNAPLAVVPMTASWRYWQDAADPPPGWTDRAYSDASWPAGPALLYVENAALPAPKNTPLTLGRMSYLFRTSFAFSGNPDGASLQLRTVLDDGAVFYLNGSAFFWLGMEDGLLPEREAAANRTVSNATDEGPFVIPVTHLRTGDNVLAVEVHQTNPGSSDLVFGAAVEVLEVRRENATPGYPNSVRALLEPFPDLWINELLADNQTGITDSRGDRDPWIELVNFESAPTGLGGYYLANTYANLTQWSFPAQATFPASRYEVVWADGEPGETGPAGWHTNFRLESPSGVVVLSRLQNGRPVVVDFLEYTQLSSDRSCGYPEPRASDTAPCLLSIPTPGYRNVSTVPPGLEILSLVVNDAGQVTLVWTATPGGTYRVEARATVEASPWELLADVVPTSTLGTHTDSRSAASAARYYRVTLLP